jgi:hypothetical protein
MEGYVYSVSRCLFGLSLSALFLVSSPSYGQPSQAFTTSVIEQSTRVNPGGTIAARLYTEISDKHVVGITYRSFDDVRAVVSVDAKAFGTADLPSTGGQWRRASIASSAGVPLDIGCHSVTVTTSGGAPVGIMNVELMAKGHLQDEQMADPESDVKQFGVFRDSLVSEIDPWTMVERNARIPRFVLPAYIGSGVLGMSIDGTGMQGLDCVLGRSKRYHQGDASHTDDMYIFGEGLISDHIGQKNIMPLGYLSYSLTVDGKQYTSPMSLVEHSSQWMRRIDLKHATVTTAFSLDSGVRVTLTCFTPYYSNRIVYTVSFESTDGARHEVRFAPQIDLLVRKTRPGEFQGQRIYDSLKCADVARDYA